MSTPFKFYLLLGLTICLSSCHQSTDPMGDHQHIIVIGIDGLSPNGITQAHTPTLDSLIAHGAATFHARTVLPSSSSSNWASMIMGADTEQHGITSNAWERDQYTLPPAVANNHGTFPSIFSLFKAQKPDLSVGAIYDWDGFGRLFEKAEVDFDIDGDHEDGTTNEAVKYIQEHTPYFTFIHLDHVDHAGHAHGHGSIEYYQSITKADSLIHAIINATRAVKSIDQTLFIISADHGGIDYGHGGESPAEMHIPFIMSGPKVKQGYKIKGTVYQYDNAATVAWLAGLTPPQAWIGRPIKEAFLGQPEPTMSFVYQPKFHPPQLIMNHGYQISSTTKPSVQKAILKIKHLNSEGEVRYTVDGSEPNLENSILYDQPDSFASNTIIKAALFVDGHISSDIITDTLKVRNLSYNHGITYSLYNTTPELKFPPLTKINPQFKGKILEFNLDKISELDHRKDHIALLFNTYLHLQEEGNYTFFTKSKAYCNVYINNQLVVINDGHHPKNESAGKIRLTPGFHKIQVEWFHGEKEEMDLAIFYKGPNFDQRPIPSNQLYLKPMKTIQ